MTDNTEQVTPNTEGEWRVHNGRDVVTSDDRYVALATSDEHAARIVADHRAARSQALLVEALRNVAGRGGRRECERYSTGIGSCFTHGRRVNAQIAAEKCCAPCIADAALKAAGVGEK